MQRTDGDGGTRSATATLPGRSFDHRDAGTSAARWSSAGLIDAAPALDLAGLRRLIVVAAHPDDESLGAGGLIATAADRGVPVTVVVATTGEASHPDSPTMRPSVLAPIRRSEVRAAVSRLAPDADVLQLDLGDGRLAESVDDLARAIRSLLAGSSAPDRRDSLEPDDAPGGVWLVAPWRHDRHPDHAAASEASRLVAEAIGCRLLEFPLWAWHWASPGDGTLEHSGLVAVDLTDSALRAKDLALVEHRSQTERLSAAVGDEAVVPPGFAEHFRRRRELFIDTAAASLDRGFFDDFYAAGTDPWGFENRWYEKRKRALTLAGLPRERFSSAFEPGCSIGVLTEELAPRCDRLLSTDISDIPLQQARRRLAGRPGVRFDRLSVPKEWPTGQFDLVVLSEIGYYCGPADLALLVEAAASSLTEDGVLVACHWRHPVRDYPTTGDAVHARIRRDSGLVLLSEHVEEDFLLDVLVRPPAFSVARQDGLLG